MGQTINDCCHCKYLTVVAVPRGEGGTQQNFTQRGSAQMSDPFRCYISFLIKKVPFCIPFIDKWFLFHIVVYNVESLLTAANALYLLNKNKSQTRKVFLPFSKPKDAPIQAGPFTDRNDRLFYPFIQFKY